MNSLRTKIKEKRSQLSSESLVFLAQTILNNIQRSISLKDYSTIATYFSVNQEVNTADLNRHLWEQDKQLFLPKIKSKELFFSAYDIDQPLSVNAFNIPEPVNEEMLITAEVFDLMFIPLVAFDTNCNRVGMGGGYYDKTLSFVKHIQDTKKPKLVGLAYELQKVDQIEKNDWDIPMDVIITEKETYFSKIS